MSQSQSMLDSYIKAEIAVLDGKEISFAGRAMKMEDLPFIQAGRREWENRVNLENARRAGTPTFAGVAYSVATFQSEN